MALVRELNRGCGRILGWGALATTLVTVVGSASGDSTYRITAEVGPEVDSNALRASSGICVPRQEVVCLCPDGNQSVQECLADGTGFGPCRACPADSDPGMVASGLMRLVADGEIRLSLGRHRLGLGYGGGAKVFFTDRARDANEVVQHGFGSWGMRLGPGIGLSLAGNYYEAFQRRSERDFRVGSGVLALSGAHRSGTSVRLGLGYRGLRYKPAPSYDFDSIISGLTVRRDLVSGEPDDTVSWRLTLSYWIAMRDYSGQAFGPRERCENESDLTLCNYLKAEGRQDIAQTLRVSVRYLGNAVAAFWYGADINHSNSFGESFTRHMVGLKFTSHLRWGVFLTTKGVLQFSEFAEPYLVSTTSGQISASTFASIDDENRSTLLVQLARDLGEHWAVHLRYSLYANETGSPTTAISREAAGFVRHLLFAGLRFNYESG